MLRGIFSPGTLVFLPPQKLTNVSRFQFDQDRGLAWKPAKADMAFSLNILLWINWFLICPFCTLSLIVKQILRSEVIWQLFFIRLSEIDLCILYFYNCSHPQLGKLLGCVAGLRNSVSGITIIAIGTSLPDTFASRSAALHDIGADASIGNITGLCSSFHKYNITA